MPIIEQVRAANPTETPNANVTKNVVGPGAEQAESTNSFPASRDDIKEARTNLVELIHSEKVRADIMNMLDQDPKMAMKSLSKLVAMFISRIVSSINGTMGKKVHPKLIKMLTELAIQEISHIAEAMGKGKMPPNAAKMLMQFTIEEMKKMLGAPQQQPQQPQGPPQGGEMAGGVSPSARQGIVGSQTGGMA